MDLNLWWLLFDFHCWCCYYYYLSLSTSSLTYLSLNENSINFRQLMSQIQSKNFIPDPNPVMKWIIEFESWELTVAVIEYSVMFLICDWNWILMNSSWRIMYTQTPNLTIIFVSSCSWAWWDIIILKRNKNNNPTLIQRNFILHQLNQSLKAVCSSSIDWVR